jgi:hypothetical protein
VRIFDRAPVTLWLVRLLWIALPVTAGPAAAGALEDWSTGPQVVAGVLLWGSWVAAVLAVLAPRPIGLTLLRVVAPAYVALAVLAAIGGAASAGSVAGALAAAIVTATVTLILPPVSVAAANGVAYGDERRFPLKTPPVLLAGPLPLACLLIGAGVATGPILIAADRPVPGAVAVVVGFGLAAFLGRAVHGLSRRWAVLVPAGLVLADPLTLPDPVLFIRERIVTLRGLEGREALAGDVQSVDLRLGALADSLLLTLDREVEFLYIRRGRRGAVPAVGTEIRFAAVCRNELLARAVERRIRVVTRRD